MAVLSDDMGGITAYAAAVNRGYTGTKEEFEQLMYSYTEVAERAEAAAGNAHESEEASIEAKDIAVGAKNEAVSARDAAQSARDASISAKNDSESARDASISAKNDTLAAKDAVMSAKGSVDETSANFSDAVTAAISDVNAAGRNQKELAKTHAIDSEAWAVGQREGADVGVSDETYHNNSKYYAEQSALAKSETETARDAAITAKDDAISAKNEAETAKGDAQDIVDGINAKSEQIDQNAEDITNLQIGISTKAEVDGNYENLTAGTAEQLASTVFIEDNAPYHFRTSGGSADIGDREYDQIVGGTINWNQLIQNGDFASATGWSIAYGSLAVENGIGTLTADSTTSASAGSRGIRQSKNYVHNHVYYASMDINPSIDTIGKIYIGYKFITPNVNAEAGVWRRISSIGKMESENFSRELGFYVLGTTSNIEGITCQFRNCVLFDLTAMFGPTIADYIYSLEQAHAGDGVAWFRKYFPKDYYEYNSGELISVSGLTAHKMTGFNQWDEEWESGGLNGENGNTYTSSARYVSKNFIPVLPNTVYYLKAPTNLSFAWYDAEKNYLSGMNSASPNFIRTSPENARYFKFSVFQASYNNDVCINLHWDGERDGEYEPYEEHSYPLDSNVELRGLFKLDANNDLYADGDTYDADGTVTRNWKELDLSQQSYTTRYTGSTNKMLSLTLTDKTPNQSSIHIKSSKYDVVQTVTGAASLANPDDYSVGIYQYYNQSSSASVNVDVIYFVVGVNETPTGKLIYKLSTPTTEQAQPFTNPQIVDDFGTEEYVTNSIVPVGHVTKYANNLRAKLEMAPNSPDGDGDYIVRQTSGLNEYVSLSSSEVIQNINEAISDNAEQIETKADVDGSYDDMRVGLARNLDTDISVTDDSVYSFRTSGGNIDIGNYEKLKKIVGGSLAVNQLADIVSESGSHRLENWASTIELLSGNRAKITSTRQASNMGAPFLTGKEFLNTHKYFASVVIKEVSVEGTPTSIQFNIYNNWTSIGLNNYKTYNGLGEYSAMFSSTVDANASTARFMVYINYGTNEVQIGDYFTIANPLFIDLTLMLGSTIADYVYTLETATAGAGVAWLKAHFPKIFDAGYIPYNAGTLEHVSGLSAHKMTGFNQWDEEWEEGGINHTTGQDATASGIIRTKGYVDVFGGMVYCFTKKTNGVDFHVHWYDADKNFISYAEVYSNSTINYNTATAPANARYMRFNLTASYGSTYNHDICINLHWDGERDGEYEPYEEHSYPLDSDVTLRGIPKLDANNNLYYDGDEYEADGTVTKRYGIVDLGTLTWAASSAYGNVYRSDANLPDAVNGIRSIGKQAPIILSTSAFKNSYNVTDAAQVATAGLIGINYNKVYVTFAEGMTAAQIKTAVSGVYMLYTLKNAYITTESADPYTEIQFVNDFGTEEFVSASESDMIVPTGHETEYPPDLKAKLEMIPNSPPSDGLWLVQHQNGVNEYVAYLPELPSNPTEDGSYLLKATRTNGVTTLSWVSDT